MSCIVKTLRLYLALSVICAAPAFAHDGVQILDPHARTNGATGSVFFVIENHSDSAERLIGVASDVAEKVEMHTHVETADAVMQMPAAPEGFPIDPMMSHPLARGGDHVMLMGLTRALTDGDTFTLTLTFAHAGQVIIGVTVDNARKPGISGQDHSGHMMSGAEATE